MNSEGTILVVDSNPANLKALAGTLTAQGYRVLQAESGETALAAAAQQPELILLDIRMPGMDGFEVFRRLKARADCRGIPVIFLSAAGNNAEWTEGFELGAVDFISKPCQSEALLTRVRTHLVLRRLQAEHAQQATELRQADEQLRLESTERQRSEAALAAFTREQMAARRAALNLMDDVVEAKSRLETVNEELRGQMAERKRAEEALRDNEQKYRELVQHANSIILRWTRDGKITFLNEFGQKFFGYAGAEILGRHVVGTLVPASDSDKGDLRSYIDQICAHPEAFEQNVNENMRRNGERVWIAWTNKVVRDERGQVKEILSIGSDITERRQAETALRESQALYHSLVEQLPAGVFRKDREGRYVYVSSWFCRLKGIKEEQFLGKTAREIAACQAVMPNVTEQSIKYTIAGADHHVRIMQTGQPIELVEEYANAAGGTQFIHAIKIPVVGPKGEVIGTQGVLFDITERKRTEVALRESEAKFSSTFNFSPLALALTSLSEGTYQDVNEVFLRDTGFKREEVIGRKINDLKIFADPMEREQLHDGLMQRGRVYGMQILARIKSGKLLHCLISSCIISAGGEKCVLSAIMDVTERKEQEREIGRLNRLYAVLSQTNQAVLRVHSPEELFASVCRIAVECGGFFAAWVGWPDPETHRLRPVARAGGGSRFLDDIEASVEDGLAGGSPTGIAIREARTVVINDYASDERTAPWRAAAARSGLLASAAFPIRRGGEVVAAFAVGAGEAGRFGDKEAQLLEEVAGEISFALDYLDKEEKRRSVEEHNQQLATVVDSSGEAIVSRSLDGIITSWNRAAEKVYGYTEAEAVGQPITILVPPDREAELADITGRLRRGEPTYHVETVRRRKDGREITVAVTVSPLRDREGRIIGAATVARDITERKQAEEALKNSESLLNEMGRIAAVGGWEMDLIARKARWTKGTYDIVEIGYGDPIPGPDEHVNFFLPEDRPVVEGALKRLVKEDIPLDFEARLRTAKGKIKWCRAMGTAVRKDGVCIRIYGAFQDITERKQAEEALRLEQALFNSLVSTIPDNIYFKDRQSRFVRINDNMARRFGLRDPSEAVGRTDADMFSAEHANQAYADEQRVLSTGQAIVGLEEKETWPDGRVTWASTTKVPLRDAKGNITGLVGISRDITERKQAEETLRVLSSRQEAILAAVPDIIMEVDNRKVYTWANEAGLAFFGDDVIGKSAAIYFEGEQTTYESVQPLFTGQQSVIYLESWQRRTDGEKRLLAWWCRVLKNETGNVIGALSSARDITEQKRANEALRESQALYKSLVTHIAAGVFRKDREGRYVFVNDRFCRLKGLSADEILGKTPQELADYQTAKEAAGPREMEPRQRTLVTQGTEHHELIMRTGQSVELEETYPQPNGKVEHFQVVKSPVFGPDGQIIGSQGIQFDITQRRQAQTALRESEQRFAQFMRNLSGLAYIKDVEGHYLFVNDAYERTFGIPVADWLGKTSKEFFPAEVADQRRQDAAPMLAERQRLVTTEKVATKAGMRFFNTIEFPIVRPDEPLLLGGISIDVTEIKQAQNEIQQLNAHLEQRVRERTGELEAANTELEAFSYSVSHDLRAPLRAINGFATILLKEHSSALSAEGQRVLNVVMKESRRMGQLIDDLLAFSRISRLSLQATEIDLATMVDEVYREQVAVAPDRKIEFQVSTIPQANADPALMRQVLANLIGNAIKYTRQRDLARIEVGGFVRGFENVFFIKDNGAGFDPRYADKLFGVFQRLHSEAEFEGTGVGLALVQRIINRHGGRVWAESQVEKGATFYFTLPSRRS